MSRNYDAARQEEVAAANRRSAAVSFASRFGRNTQAAPPPTTMTAGGVNLNTYSPLLSHSASSSVITNASNTSKFSLSTSFVNLSSRDVAIFDQVIDQISSGADDFASLKRAYNMLREQHKHNIDEEKDAYLWDVLLKLVQVRGKDWNTRWDAVRMAIGLEPRIVSESEREPRDEDDDEEDEESTSESDTVRDKHQSGPSRLVAQPNNTTRAEIETLRKRMAMLTAEAGSLVGSIAKRAEEKGEKGTPIPSILATKREGGNSNGRVKETPGRQLRFAEQQLEMKSSHHKATVVESASDEEAATRTRAVPQRLSAKVVSSSSENKPIAAQRQFDEVVARSRIEREAQKKAREEQQEAELEARLLPLLNRASRLTSLNLQKKCFSWWKISFQQKEKRQLQTRRMNNLSILSKATAAWRQKLLRKKEQMRGAQKVDIVRCKLRAWRVWRRSLQEARYVRREEKKSLLKGAFLLTRKMVEERMFKEAFLQWKIAFMQHRTVEFRTQHLVRGAFSLWRLQMWRNRSLQEKQCRITNRVENDLILRTFTQWKDTSRLHSMTHLADAFHRHHLIQECLLTWTRIRDDRATIRRKEALADRWRSLRSKRTALHSWLDCTRRLRYMQDRAEDMRLKSEATLLATLLKVWILREREQLLERVKTSTIQIKSLVRWCHTYRRLTSHLETLEIRLSDKMKMARIRQTFTIWKEVTKQTVLSQHLAGERDCRKMKSNILSRWKEALTVKRNQMQKAKLVDARLLVRQMYIKWCEKHIEAKSLSLEHRNRRKMLGITFTFWKARSLERRQETLAIEHMRSRIKARVQKACLARWTNAVIERKSLLLEAGDRRDALLLRLAFSKWIQACLRHEDLLSLSKSFLDVKKEDLLRRTFVKWITLTRSIQSRRERAENLLQQKKRAMAVKMFDYWYDRYVEASLRPLEFKALLQRQQTAMSSIFTQWKSQTKSLPAIQLDHARRKSYAFYKWQERLPLARLENKAIKKDRLMMQEKDFKHWYEAARAKRALRAAARFGGPSAIRLKTLAHFRQGSGKYPFGGGEMNSSSPDGRRPRLRRVDSLKSACKNQAAISSGTLIGSKEEQGSLRESDLVVGESSKTDLNLNRYHQDGANLHFKTPSEAMPPVMQRWMQGFRKLEGEDTLADDDVEASSEPPSSILGQRYAQGRSRINRTPSPSASQAHSEATMRVKNSPRKLKKTDAGIDWLRSKRRQQSRSMIFDNE